MKTIAYIDAGNLYYGLLRGRPKLKWLDPFALVRALLRKDHDIVKVRFYTARVRTCPHDAEATERQRLYLRALDAMNKVEIVEGYYNRNKVWMPAVGGKCRECDESTDGRIRVVKLEEKRTDVNIATDMLYDAFSDASDSLALVSGDSDFVAPLDLIRKRFNKQVLVFDPHERFSDICYHASYYAHIPRDLPARCQLPDTIPCGPRGDRFIHRPPAWM